MTTPLSVPPRSAGRGLALALATAGMLALAWVCAVLYTVAAWALA
ncbi:morphogenic membrane protein MmpA [Streptomyces sp. NPDC051180]